MELSSLRKQIQHGKQRPVGFTKEGLISVKSSNDLKKHYEALQADLLATGVVASVCKTNAPPTQWWSSNSGWHWKGANPGGESVIFTTLATGYDYAKTMSIQLKEGSDKLCRPLVNSNSQTQPDNGKRNGKFPIQSVWNALIDARQSPSSIVPIKHPDTR